VCFVVIRELPVSENNPELDDLCTGLQLSGSTTSAVKRLISVLYSLHIVEVSACGFELIVETDT